VLDPHGDLTRDVLDRLHRQAVSGDAIEPLLTRRLTY
jgi:hypothetical protein